MVNDPVVGDEGGLTADARLPDVRRGVRVGGAARKWDLVRDHVRPGRIVDIGCGAGAVLELADREPALRESDLIGVEVARHLYEECVHKKAQGVFPTPTCSSTAATCSAARSCAARSVDTTLTFALTHEIWSYGSQVASLRAFVQADLRPHRARRGLDQQRRLRPRRPGPRRCCCSLRPTTG